MRRIGGLILAWHCLFSHADAQQQRGGLLLETGRLSPRGQLDIVSPCGRMVIEVWPRAGLILPGAGPMLNAGSARGDDGVSRLIDEVAALYGHEAPLMKAIVRVESNFDARAVSRKGAVGLMQVMPATASGLGVADPAIRLFEPGVNLRAGALHLRALRDRYPQRLDLALAAYNAGEGAVQRWSGVPPYPETRHYVESVLSWYGVYQDSGAARERHSVTRCS